MKKEHDLKTWPKYFREVWEERKPFELRKNDRDFQVGDLLILWEYDPIEAEFSGARIRCRVTYMTDFPMALFDGYVCLGLDIRSKTPAKDDERR